MSGAGGSADPGITDPGLQAERTRLSWARTALALAVIGALMLHPFDHVPTLAAQLPGVAMLLLASATWAYGSRRYRFVIAAVRAGRPIAAAAHIRAFGVLCLLPAALGLWAVLT